MNCAIVTPARNEAANLLRLSGTVIGQTSQPFVWVIVDDGSTDRTADLAAELAGAHEWILLEKTGRAGAGLEHGRREGRDLIAFQTGIAAIPTAPDVVVKVDADVTLGPDYLERLLEAFAADPQLGMASGTRSERVGDRWRARSLTGNAVEGMCRAYRWGCWVDVQPLAAVMGWDGVDEAKAWVSGWRTGSVEGLHFSHHRPVGHRDGRRLRARAAEGEAAHYMGYRPTYLLARTLWRLREGPAAVGLVWGYLRASLCRYPQCPDPAARAYVRRQQAARHLWLRAREASGVGRRRG